MVVPGKPLKLGRWVEAWWIVEGTGQPWAGLRYANPSSVRRVIVARWKRSRYDSWVIRDPEREYPQNGYWAEAGTDGWGRSLFLTEAEAWAAAANRQRTRIERLRRELRLAEAELQDVEQTIRAKRGLP